MKFSGDTNPYDDVNFYPRNARIRGMQDRSLEIPRQVLPDSVDLGVIYGATLGELLSFQNDIDQNGKVLPLVEVIQLPKNS